MKIGKDVLWFAGGVLLTPEAAYVAVLSGGAGHGHYEAARALFPGPMLLTRLTGDTLTLPVLLLALAQFPLYGAAVGWSASRGRTTWGLVSLLAGHAAAVILCFAGLLPNFS
jgi:hypothetical protein